MDRLRVRISRCSLALSLAVKLGLAAWLVVALLGGPTGSVALTSPNMLDLRAEAPVELAQTRQSKRRARAARLRRDRERMEAETASEQKTDKQSKQQNAGSASDKDAKAGSGPSEVSKSTSGGDNASKAASPDHPPAEAQPETKEQVWSEAEI